MDVVDAVSNFDFIWAVFPILFSLIFAAAAVGIIITIVKGISSSHRLSQTVDRTVNQAVNAFSGGLQALRLNDRGNFLIPQIQRDFPDFSPVVAIGCAKEAVMMKYGNDVQSVGNAVISDYTRSADKSTVVLEVSATLRMSGCRKYIVLYENSVEQNLNCPQCGASLKESNGTTCAYCGSPIEKYEIEGWKVTAVMVG